MRSTSSVIVIATSIASTLAAAAPAVRAEAPPASSLSDEPRPPTTFVRGGLEAMAVGNGEAFGPRVTWSPSRGALYAEVGGFAYASSWDAAMLGVVGGGGLRRCSPQLCLSLGLMATVGVSPGQTEARDGHPNGRWYVAEGELSTRVLVAGDTWVGLTAALGPVGEPNFYVDGYYEDDLEWQGRLMLSLDAATAHEAPRSRAAQRAARARARSPWIATASVGVHGPVDGLRVAVDRTIRGPFTVGGAVWGGTHTSLASETFDLAGGGAAASAGVRSQGDRIIASADVTLAAEYMSYRQDAVTKRQLGINPGASARLLAAAGAFVVGLELRVRLPGALVQFADSDGQDLAGGFSPGAGVVVGGRW